MTDPRHRQRIEDLCDAALDRSADERAAFVTAACGNDDALRQEVESLLAHAHKAEGFLATPVGELAAQIMIDEQGESLVGRRIGSHEILCSSARAGWATCIVPAIPSWAARSPSRSCHTDSNQFPRTWPASSSKPGCSQR